MVTNVYTNEMVEAAARNGEKTIWTTHPLLGHKKDGKHGATAPAF